MTTHRLAVELAPQPETAPRGWALQAANWLVRLEHTAPDARGLAAQTPDLVDRALRFACELGAEHPFPASGRTAQLFEALATVAAADLGAARAIEPHLDALAILDQAGLGDGHSASDTWGVFAAEGGPAPLTATYASADATWMLNGTKLWCSLADRLDRALVSATVVPEDPPGGLPGGLPGPLPGSPHGGERRRLFSVDLRQPGVRVEPGAWHARGLVEVPSGPVRFDDVECEPVGEPGWYLSRPGFAWGGIGVAACWYGGAVGVARALYVRAAGAGAAPSAGAGAGTAPSAGAGAGAAPSAAPAPTAASSAAPRDRPPGTPAEPAQRVPDPFLLMHLGSIDEHLGDARRALAEAAALIDAGRATGEPGRLLAERVRATVARASEAVLTHTAHALGPAPLALDAGHAKRVADLELYVRQHHAEKDSAALGRQLVAGGVPPW